MKICFLAPSNSVHSFRWINYFKTNHKVHWISLNKLDKNFVLEGITYHDLSGANPIVMNTLNSLFKVKKIIKNIEPDILHIHSAGIYGFIGYFVNFKPCVLTAWGSDVLVNKNNFFKKIVLKKILQNASLITTDANHMKREIVELGIHENKIKKVMFGIDINFFKPLTNKKEMKKKLGFNPDDIVITSFRNFYKVYDINTFIKAAKIISKKYVKLKFLLIGSGPEENKLKTLVSDLGLEKQTLFTGSLSQDKVLEYLNASDIYVSTSLSDAGISSSTAEAMACGLVPVISKIGENNLWVKDSYNGYLFSAGDSIELSKQITKLITDTEKIKKFSKNTRNIIEKKNNYYLEMSLMEKLYLKYIKMKK